MAKIIQVTQSGLAQLRRELHELTKVKLPAVISRVAKAREYGDLSENAEYHSAKEDQTLVETRIDEIQSIIANAKVVKVSHGTSKVAVGSTVVVSVKTADGKGKPKTQTFHIVGEFEADPVQGKISGVSPLGQALMDKKKGDEAKVEVPAGTMMYKILEIK